MAVSAAVFSEDRVYRYRLGRHFTSSWHPSRGVLNIIGLNPSTADELLDDPTIRRCIAFARGWQFDGLVMTNLFAYRATDPFQLRYQGAKGVDLVGPDNDRHILEAAEEAGMVVAAWGVMGGLMDRAQLVTARLAYHKIPMHCFGTTKAGHPKHPLYLPKTTQPVLWM